MYWGHLLVSALFRAFVVGSVRDSVGDINVNYNIFALFLDFLMKVFSFAEYLIPTILFPALFVFHLQI